MSFSKIMANGCAGDVQVRAGCSWLRIILKNPQELALMREAGRCWHRVFFAYFGRQVKWSRRPCRSTLWLRRFIVDQLGARPGQQGPVRGTSRIEFRQSITLVCHGVPSRYQVLKSGDVFSSIGYHLERGGFICHSGNYCIWAGGNVPLAKAWSTDLRRDVASFAWSNRARPVGDVFSRTSGTVRSRIPWRHV